MCLGLFKMDIESMPSGMLGSSSDLDDKENEALTKDHQNIDRELNSILRDRDWSICGGRVPKNQVTFFVQIIVVYGIIIVSIAHLSLQSSNQELWLVLLSSAFGYILPSPGLKYIKTKGSSGREEAAASVADSPDSAFVPNNRDA